MSEFSDRPFVAGSLIGMRAFSVDSLGRLLGPSYGQVFKPGENVAECRKREDTYGWSMLTTAYDRSVFLTPAAPAPAPVHASRTFNPGGVVRANYEAAAEKIEEKTRSLSEEAVEPTPIPEHKLAGMGCSCGFYAYFDGRNSYKDPSRITALIEGYGVCVVGTAGFRAEKARLVALVRPGKRVAADLIQRNYPDVPMYDTKREALAAHPLTVDAAPSPDEDDFWTREVK